MHWTYGAKQKKKKRTMRSKWEIFGVAVFSGCVVAFSFCQSDRKKENEKLEDGNYRTETK